ncbi:MAG: type II secretion system F family protein [Acidimicrobiia bacterium]
MPPIPAELLGIAWGALAAVPFAARARRATLAQRLGLPGREPVARRHLQLLGGARSLIRRALDATGPVGRVVRGLGARRRARRADAALERELPVALDLLGVAVGAGCTPYLAVDVASRWASPTVASSFRSVLGACTLGASFEAALDDAARTAPRLRPLADALLASDRLGAPVGPALAPLAAEERAALRRRAEAHARRVPVRLLFPLVFLVLPAFVLLTVIPGLAAGLSRL